MARSNAWVRLVDQLLWDCNRRVIETTQDRMLLHAAAADLDGVGVVLPGGPDQGKSTLVAGLAQRGLAYLTDELAAVDPDTLEVTGYPKPLTIDPGSWETLDDLKPTQVWPGRRHWQVSPDRLPAGWRATTIPRAIVLPRFRKGEHARLQETRGANLVVELAHCTFAFTRNTRRDLDVLARLATEAPHRYELVYGDLDAACGLILNLLRSVRSGVS